MAKKIIFISVLFLCKCIVAQDISTHIFDNNRTFSLDDAYKHKLVKKSYSYINTPYKYAGSSKKGMDCSGLVCTVFDEIGIQLPRRSSDIAKKGVYILADDIQVGDLIFFKGRTTQSVNHVALVSKIENGLIYILHATSSKGVIEEVLQHNAYFYKRWLFNKRVTQ